MSDRINMFPLLLVIKTAKLTKLKLSKHCKNSVFKISFLKKNLLCSAILLSKYLSSETEEFQCKPPLRIEKLKCIFGKY